MTSIGITPTSIEWNVTKSTDSIMSFTCTDSNGNPLDITNLSFYFVAREEKNITSTKVIEILNADITQSDSGSGTTDTFTIDLTNSLTNVSQRIYYFEIRSANSLDGANYVWFNGKLNIQWTVQEAR